jgi:hypothetical protein
LGRRDYWERGKPRALWQVFFFKVYRGDRAGQRGCLTFVGADSYEDGLTKKEKRHDADKKSKLDAKVQAKKIGQRIEDGGKGKGNARGKNKGRKEN